VVLAEAINELTSKLLGLTAEELILALVVFLILMFGWDKIRDWMENKDK